MREDRFLVRVDEVGAGMTVNLRDIGTGELSLERLETEKLNDISVEVVLKTTATGITANFAVTFEAAYDCVRCLEPFVRKTVSELLLVYTEGRDPLWRQDRAKLEVQDTERISYTGPYLDLKPGIREAIILAMPIAAVCAGDCPGLCPVCGRKKGSSNCQCRSSAGGIFSPNRIGARKRQAGS